MVGMFGNDVSEMGRMLSAVAILVVAVAFIHPAPSSAQNTGGSIPSDLEWQVVDESTFRMTRRSVDVRLSRKVDEGILRTIAHRLHDQAPNFTRTFIVYYLPGMEVDAGGWATSHFNPDLQVEVLGTPLGTSSQVEQYKDEYGEDLVGVWENNQVGSASTFVLAETSDAFVLARIYPDGSSGTTVLVETQSPRGRRFEEPGNATGEFYLLRNGRLELHDDLGVVFVAIPLSRSN